MNECSLARRRNDPHTPNQDCRTPNVEQLRRRTVSTIANYRKGRAEPGSIRAEFRRPEDRIAPSLPGRVYLRAFRRRPQHDPVLLTQILRLRKILRPTPVVPLEGDGMRLFAKLEYTNPVGSIKDRPAWWILKRAAERGEICGESTVIESSSGNFACALATYTRFVGLKFIPVIDPNISSSYESFLRRLCPRVVKVEQRDDTGGFLKTRLEMVRRLRETIPLAYWTNQYGNPDAVE